MPHARIISTGGYQPGEPITNADIERSTVVATESPSWMVGASARSAVKTPAVFPVM